MTEKAKKEEETKLKRSLNVSERITLLNVLPEKGGYITVKLVGDLREKLFPTAAEFKRVGAEEDSKTGQLFWKGGEEFDKAFSFAGFETKLIVERLQALDKDEELTALHISLYEKFVEN